MPVPWEAKILYLNERVQCSRLSLSVLTAVSPDKQPHANALASRPSLCKQDSVSTAGWLSHHAKGPVHEELVRSGKGGTYSDSPWAGRDSDQRAPGRGGGPRIKEWPLPPALDSDRELMSFTTNQDDAGGCACAGPITLPMDSLASWLLWGFLFALVY